MHRLFLSSIEERQEISYTLCCRIFVVTLDQHRRMARRGYGLSSPKLQLKVRAICLVRHAIPDATIRLQTVQLLFIR